MRARLLPINTPPFEKVSMYGVTRDGVRKKQNKNKNKKKTKQKKKTCGVKFLRAYLPSCLHEEINSFRLSLENANKRHNTKLGKYIWYLKENLTKFKVTGRILKHAALYNPTCNWCNLCLWER